MPISLYPIIALIFAIVLGLLDHTYQINRYKSLELEVKTNQLAVANQNAELTTKLKQDYENAVNKSNDWQKSYQTMVDAYNAVPVGRMRVATVPGSCREPSATTGDTGSVDTGSAELSAAFLEPTIADLNECYARVQICRTAALNNFGVPKP